MTKTIATGTIVWALSMLLSGCATYSSSRIDEKTGMYEGNAVADPVWITKSVSGVDLNRYAYVYLQTRSNFYPARFEYYVRHALFRNGFVRVLNQQELTQLVLDTPRLASINSLTDPVAVRRLSMLAGPILQVSYDSTGQGARNYTDFSVHDLSTGELLFQIKFDKVIWTDSEKETMQPVLNAFKVWVDQNRAAGGSAV
ncbi:hypothetical protein F8A86_14505 [Betaproteobacteria bacterium SCN1]|jgi:hypothetical protein|nr:hypothetical protein F8A86_14505 [Betaproteobacteria bacterium SCN1]MBN8759232.1 hypothetical protein [Thiobacillus sp.]ODU90191.1 MAG: hypothetical protein ABT21_05935 [Thiobacillus sp. SCN 65-179]OJW38373.1 MAG: hypothetical protein BGO61_12685 [Thiobacillus sp. 65-69]